MAVPWWRSTDRVGTPCQARNVAADSPTRLPPTIRTSVSIIMPVPVSGQSEYFLAHRKRLGKPAFPFSDHARDHWWSMIFPENRLPLFRIMLYIHARPSWASLDIAERWQSG